MHTIDETDFRAAGLRDPELAAAFLAERRREAVRRMERLRARRRLDGVDGDPGAPREATEAELMDRARRVVADRRAFRASPEGRFLAALEEIGDALGLAVAILEEARSARCRGFEAERAFCHRKVDALVELSRRLRSAALDASLAASS